MRIFLLVTAVLTFTTCGGSSSSSPSTPTGPTATNTQPASPTTNWIVSHRFMSVTGADNCWVRRQRDSLTGVVFTDMEMTVTRSGGSITIASPWFGAYTGTIVGTDLTARQGPPLEGGRATDCSGTQIMQLPGVSHLSGRFAADDRTLAATESNVYPLNTGETVTYTWEWQARRSSP
jgi:hypothetical protein